MTIAELTRLVQEAKAKVAAGSALVKRAQRRVEKFHGKYEAARKAYHRARKAHRLRKAEVYRRRMARAKRKTQTWTRREADAIEVARDWKAALARRIAKRKAALQPNGATVVKLALGYVGVREGSTLQREWANGLGYSAALPWCSIFVANMLIKAGVCTRDQLPVNPAYSGSWFAWARGRRVNRSEVRQGDLLIFDWGDGGITDHVAIYAGAGLKIGGNENDRVEHDAVPWSNVVGIVRPL